MKCVFDCSDKDFGRKRKTTSRITLNQLELKVHVRMATICCVAKIFQLKNLHIQVHVEVFVYPL